MKMKYKIITSLTALTIFGVVSCKDTFLNVAPTGALATSTLGTKAGVEGALIGAYSVLNGNVGGGFYTGYDNWLWGGVTGGDANKGSNAGDQADAAPVSRFEVLPTNSLLGGTWGSGYEGVSRSNKVLNLLASASGITPEDTKRITAEARFLRGHFHFNLKKIFGNIPYVDETKDYGTGADKIPNNVSAWPMIEADFKAAMDNLPETQPQAGRANKWAAASYLAKTYMFQNKFAEAKALFDQIIASGKIQAANKLVKSKVAHYRNLACYRVQNYK